MVSVSLQREVTQEELVKRGTRLLEPSAEVVFIVVVFILNEPNLLIRMVLLLASALCRVALGLGFLAADQELIDFAAILGLLLSVLGCGRVSDRCASLIGCTRIGVCWGD